MTIRDKIGRDDTRTVPRVDTGLLNMLHHAADNDGTRGVSHGIDIELKCILEKLVDEDRMLWRGVHRLCHVAVKRACVVHDRHRSTTEHVGRTHHKRIADLTGDLPRFLTRSRNAVRGLRNSQFPQKFRKSLSVLG